MREPTRTLPKSQGPVSLPLVRSLSGSVVDMRSEPAKIVGDIDHVDGVSPFGSRRFAAGDFYGVPLFCGIDVLIKVNRANEISTWMGESTPFDQAGFKRFIRHYGDKIARYAGAILYRPGDVAVFAGRWYRMSKESPHTLKIYLTYSFTGIGNLIYGCSAQFSWSEEGVLDPTRLRLWGGDLARNNAAFSATTDLAVARENHECSEKDDVALFEGMVWYEGTSFENTNFFVTIASKKTMARQPWLKPPRPTPKQLAVVDGASWRGLPFR